MVAVSFATFLCSESMSNPMHVTNSATSIKTNTPDCADCVDRMHPSANPRAMPDVAVARYERHTTWLRLSETFALTASALSMRNRAMATM